MKLVRQAVHQFAETLLYFKSDDLLVKIVFGIIYAFLIILIIYLCSLFTRKWSTFFGSLLMILSSLTITSAVGWNTMKHEMDDEVRKMPTDIYSIRAAKDMDDGRQKLKMTLDLEYINATGDHYKKDDIVEVKAIKDRIIDIHKIQ